MKSFHNQTFQLFSQTVKKWYWQQMYTSQTKCMIDKHCLSCTLPFVRRPAKHCVTVVAMGMAQPFHSLQHVWPHCNSGQYNTTDSTMLEMSVVLVHHDLCITFLVWQKSWICCALLMPPWPWQFVSPHLLLPLHAFWPALWGQTAVSSGQDWGSCLD